jgi:hypothetical protein
MPSKWMVTLHSQLEIASVLTHSHFAIFWLKNEKIGKLMGKNKK